MMWKRGRDFGSSGGPHCALPGPQGATLPPSDQHDVFGWALAATATAPSAARRIRPHTCSPRTQPPTPAARPRSQLPAAAPCAAPWCASSERPATAAADSSAAGRPAAPWHPGRSSPQRAVVPRRGLHRLDEWRRPVLLAQGCRLLPPAQDELVRAPLNSARDRSVRRTAGGLDLPGDATADCL